MNANFYPYIVVTLPTVQEPWLPSTGPEPLAPTRSSGRDVVHIDIAFPLDGDDSIDSVQFLIESKRSF